MFMPRHIQRVGGALVRSRSPLRLQMHRLSFSSYPAHQILPMPALSPTMVQGNVAQWMLKEGDEIEPGSVICEIETDKATVDFEAQDDGFLAKILQLDGAKDIPVGQPIGVVVEEKEDIAAFANFTIADAGGGESSKSSAETKPEKPKLADAPASAPVAPTPTPQQQSPPKPAPVSRPPSMHTPAPAQNIPQPVQTRVTPTPSSVVQSRPAEPKNFKSPLLRKLAKEHNVYEQLYGTTLMKPLSSE
mmetsp:Transcript_8636/g.11297  ORF Transcript_8636/g.11297 Transcript_8636/m.11297 type:complete len:246 (+) Transcript_8636:77-814(+)